MIDLGDHKVGSTVYLPWNTNATDGASITRSTNGTVAVYKNDGLTQDTDGITDNEDFDGVTGVHLVKIDTSADATFYDAGGQFTVVVSGAVIDGKTVNAALGTFSLEKRSQWDLVRASHNTVGTFGEVIETAHIADAVLDDARFTSATAAITAIDDLLDTEIANIQSRLPTALVSGRIDASVGAMAAGTLTAAAIAADAITDAKVAADVTIASVTGSVGSVTGAVGSVTGNVGGSVASVTGLTASDIAAIKAKTDNLPTDPADQSLVIAATDALAVLVGEVPTNAELATALGTADDAVLAQVALVKAVTDKIDDTLEDDGGTYRFTTNALEQGPTGGGASAATIADAVWDEVRAGHVTAGTFGEVIELPDIADEILDDARFTAATAAIDTIDNLLDTEVAAIKAKTDNLPAAPAAVADIPTANANADALLDRANGIETGWTLRQAARIILSVLGGKASGMATTTVKFRDMADAKDRVTATVDSSGNRSSVTRDAT